MSITVQSTALRQQNLSNPKPQGLQQAHDNNEGGMHSPYRQMQDTYLFNSRNVLNSCCKHNRRYHHHFPIPSSL